MKLDNLTYNTYVLYTSKTSDTFTIWGMTDNYEYEHLVYHFDGSRMIYKGNIRAIEVLFSGRWIRL